MAELLFDSGVLEDELCDFHPETEADNQTVIIIYIADKRGVHA